jgi:hypothetical protein
MSANSRQLTAYREGTALKSQFDIDNYSGLARCQELKWEAAIEGAKSHGILWN